MNKSVTNINDDINLNDLKSFNCSISDVSSLVSMVELSSTISSPLNAELSEFLIRDVMQGDQFQLLRAAPAIERWIVSDFLAFDRIALEVSQNENLPIFLENISKLLPMRFFDIDSSFFEWCDSVINRTVFLLEKHGPPDVRWQSFGFGEEKRYHDLRNNFASYSRLSRSNLGVERTLFYYELSAYTQAPVVFHPHRRIEIENVSKTIKSAFEEVKKEANNTIESVLKGDTNLMDGVEIEYPALFFYAIRMAGRKNKSIIDSMTEIRESEGARNFRDWIGRAQANLRSTSPSDAIAFNKEMNEIRGVLDQWQEELDLDAGIKYTRKNLNLTKIPRIGWIFELLNLDNPAIKNNDPNIYMEFVSDWYK